MAWPTIFLFALLGLESAWFLLPDLYYTHFCSVLYHIVLYHYLLPSAEQ